MLVTSPEAVIFNLINPVSQHSLLLEDKFLREPEYLHCLSLIGWKIFMDLQMLFLAENIQGLLNDCTVLI